MLIDEEDLAAAIHEMLSVEARELIGPLKIRRARKKRKAGAASEMAEGAAHRTPDAEDAAEKEN